MTDGSSASVPWGTIAPGRQIGKYQILQHMATGGMAEIYLARALGIQKFQKLVVIKRILPGHANNPEIRNMLLDEARIAATLHHSNIVQVFDIGETAGEYFYCMEYLHGRDVASVVNAARGKGLLLAEDQAISIVLGVCAALHYAHEKTDDGDRPLGIVHRDISPTNVFVTFDGGVKVLDFGLVKAEGRTTESRSGAVKGKLAYMSPEQCRAKACDRRADIFAVAIMLWELTTGKRLFTGECDFDFLTAILEKQIPRPGSVMPGYPAELERIVMKGLARDPAGRYDTAETMQLELEEYARDRKLRISPITLRHMMDQLFAEDLASWHSARRAGVALEDHIIEHIPLAEGSVIASGVSGLARSGSDTSRSIEPAAPAPSSAASSAAPSAASSAASSAAAASNVAKPIAAVAPSAAMPVALASSSAVKPIAPRRRSLLPWLLGIGVLGAGAAAYLVVSGRLGTENTPANQAAETKPAGTVEPKPAETKPAGTADTKAPEPAETKPAEPAPTEPATEPKTVAGESKTAAGDPVDPPVKEPAKKPARPATTRPATATKPTAKPATVKPPPPTDHDSLFPK